MNLINKIWSWIKMNIATILGTAQLLVKALKELLTAIINVLSIFFPVIATEKFIMATRDILNKLDEWIEKAKPYLIPKVA